MEKHKEKGILVVVSGFSGAGKGTIMKNLTPKNMTIMPCPFLPQPENQDREKKMESLTSL